MEQKQITYAERRPHGDLQKWIQCLWTFEATALDEPVYQHFVPPDGCISILRKRQLELTPSTLVVVGPRWEPHNVPIYPGDCYDGVRFWPFAARALISHRLPQLVGRIGILEMFFSDLAEKMSAALQRQPKSAVLPFHAAVQDVLLHQFASAEGIDPLAYAATARITVSRGNEPMSIVAAGLDVGLRQLQRRFRSATGLTLKQFARIRRFREAAGELLLQSPRPWCQVALDAGYADQAHLTREFSQMIGLSARELQAKLAAIVHDSVQP